MRRMTRSNNDDKAVHPADVSPRQRGAFNSIRDLVPTAGTRSRMGSKRLRDTWPMARSNSDSEAVHPAGDSRRQRGSAFNSIRDLVPTYRRTDEREWR